MEEDEEVLLERSTFHHHLRNAGFTEFETKTVENLAPSYPPFTSKKETIDVSIIDEVLTVRATNLLFEDDRQHVDCVFANFDVNRNEHMRSMFRGKTSAIVLALGLCIYLYIGSYAFVLVSVFYAYRTSEYLWQKHRRLKQLKRLMLVIQSNYSLLTEVLKFLYESDNMLKTRFGTKMSQNTVDFVNNLKVDFIGLQHGINNIFADATCRLLKEVTLWENFENPSCYISSRIIEFKDCANVSQLHNMYMLLQSQFLTRLIFSLVPNLVEKPENSNDVINQIIVKITARLRQIHDNLNKKFKFVLLNGICQENKKPARPLPEKKRQKNMSVEMLTRNIHDLSSSLQYSLIKARELEISLSNNENPSAEKELMDIQSELSSCQSHIADLLIMQKKFSPEASKDIETAGGINFKMSDSEPIQITEIGYPDLDPEVDDDIFETVVCDLTDNREQFDWEKEEIDPLAKKKQKEMLGELKIRLKQQAEDWARREAQIMTRKGMSPPQINQPENSEEESSNDEFESTLRKRRKISHESFGNSSEDEFQTAEGTSVFAQELLKARRTLVTGNLTEEDFCCSGENSDVES